jgi:hypothetical protein
VVAKVTLGWPRPLGVVNALETRDDAGSSGIQKATYVVRGSRPIQNDEPRFLPNDFSGLNEQRDPANYLPDVRPTQATLPVPKDKAKAAEADKEGKVLPEKLAAPKISTPPPPEERIIILESNNRLGDGWGRSLFGMDWAGDSRFYARGEFLLWTTRGFHLPPLVTTASPFDPEATRAALGFGNTSLLFGDTNTTGGLRPGARFTLGYNFDPCGLCAIEANFFFLAPRHQDAFFSSDINPVLGRPFFNINTGQQDRELSTSPGLLPGDVFNGVGALQVFTSTRLLGAELNHRRLLCCGCDYEVTGLVGFRYLDLNDRLRIEENIVSLRDIPGNPGNPPISRAGDQILVFDQFNTSNRFYGGQLGLNAEWRRGAWYLDTGVKVALGVTHQTIDIDGGQRITSLDGRVQNFRGGLLALPSNIGHFSQSRFGFVPEVGVKVGYSFTENIRAFVGFDWLYWSSVVRPGDQIDLALDANAIPNSGAPFPPAGQVRPRVPFRTSSYWALGLNAGLEIRY